MEKKIILFIVEGNNDKLEINSIINTPFFNSYFIPYRVDFLVINNDITADVKSKENNIQDILNRAVIKYRRDGGLYPNIKVSDIECIIHVVDLDGAFIPRENILYEDVEKYRYEDEYLYVREPDRAFGRNRKKANIINRLTKIQRIDNIKYKLFFVSCNMDHMLFGDRNPPQYQKRTYANSFVKECKENPSCIYESVLNNDICYDCSYEESWETIQYGTNSLKRHTNLNIYLSSIMSEPN